MRCAGPRPFPNPKGPKDLLIWASRHRLSQGNQSGRSTTLPGDLLVGWCQLPERHPSFINPSAVQRLPRERSLQQ